MPQRCILGERAPGQRSPIPKSRDTTGDDDVHFAQAVVAVAIVGCCDRIGNHSDAVCTSNTDGQLEHRRRNVLEISDQFDHHAVVEQERRHRTRLPMMQR